MKNNLITDPKQLYIAGFIIAGGGMLLLAIIAACGMAAGFNLLH